jgi:hypothetical protein
MSLKDKYDADNRVFQQVIRQHWREISAMIEQGLASAEKYNNNKHLARCGAETSGPPPPRGRNEAVGGSVPDPLPHSFRS